MSFAVVFSGQGAQHPAMLPWLRDDDPLLRLTSRLLGVADWRDTLADPAGAARNLNAQLLLTGTAIAAWVQLSPLLGQPVAVAGYSVGELAAFCAAGVIRPEQALTLAEARARAMDLAALAAPGTLMGVTGIGRPLLDKACAAHGLELAIDNGPSSAVVGGSVRALEDARAGLDRLGARCTLLRVGIASHTRVMRPAAVAFSHLLSQTPLEHPRATLLCNATGERCADAAAARTALSAQIQQTVRWCDCMDALYARRPRCVLEVGPGQALARMWNDRHADVPARSCDEFRSPQALAKWVAAAAR